MAALLSCCCVCLVDLGRWPGERQSWRGCNAVEIRLHSRYAAGRFIAVNFFFGTLVAAKEKIERTEFGGR